MNKIDKLLPIDIISYIYILFNLIYLTIGRKRVPDAGFHLLIFTSIAIIIFLMIVFYKPDSSKLFSFFRHWYPFISLAYFFNVSTIANHILFPEFIDPFFQRIDYYLFGYQPAIEWGTRYNHIIIQELFHFAYFSYYFVVPGVALLVLFKKREYLNKYIFTVTFVFYVCYITYSFLPVVGGRYWEDIYNLTMTYRGGPFTHIMAFIYTNSQHFGSAFPSSHVAITVVVNIAAFNYSKKLGLILIPLSFLLTIATVYCHYHYFIDTIFGVIYALIFYKPAEMLYDYLIKIIPNQSLQQEYQNKTEAQ